MTSKFNTGDTVTVNYGIHSLGRPIVTVSSVVEVSPTQYDYTVTFPNGDTDIVDESELVAFNPHAEIMADIEANSPDLQAVNQRVIPLTLEEYIAMPKQYTNTELTESDAKEVIESLGVPLSEVISVWPSLADKIESSSGPIATHIRIIHECNGVSMLMKHSELELDLLDRDKDEYPSYSEFEEYAIQRSYELFPVEIIECDECNELRLVWLRYQLTMAGMLADTLWEFMQRNGIEYMVSSQALNSLRQAIKHELLISRDIDSEN